MPLGIFYSVNIMTYVELMDKSIGGRLGIIIQNLSHILHLPRCPFRNWRTTTNLLILIFNLFVSSLSNYISRKFPHVMNFLFWHIVIM